MSQALAQKWHDHIANPSPEGLAALLADDCCFYSPVVFTPQKGKEVCMRYLLSAAQVFDAQSKFRYVREVLDGDNFVLEFEAEIDGKYLNGVDLIHWNADGKIDNFKVMIRPLQAVNLLWEKMGQQLAAAS